MDFENLTDAEVEGEINKGFKTFKVFAALKGASERLRVLKSEIDHAEKQKGKVTEELITLSQEAEDAKGDVEAAKAEAKKILSDSKEKAAGFLEAERAKIKEERAELDAERDEHEALLSKIRDDLLKAGEELDALNDQIIEAREKLESLKSEQEKILKKFEV